MDYIIAGGDYETDPDGDEKNLSALSIVDSTEYPDEDYEDFVSELRGNLGNLGNLDGVPVVGAFEKLRESIKIFPFNFHGGQEDSDEELEPADVADPIDPTDVASMIAGPINVADPIDPTDVASMMSEPIDVASMLEETVIDLSTELSKFED